METPTSVKGQRLADKTQAHSFEYPTYTDVGIINKNNRKCTDVLSFIGHLGLGIAFAVYVYFALKKGNLHRIQAPIDGTGRMCGVDGY